MDTRLKEVRQTDLTEGRINQEFVDWLQTKGTSWLLVILVALCAYLGIVRWKSHAANVHGEAWKALTEAKIPTNLEKVAEDYAGIDAVPELARIQAGSELMIAVQKGQAIGSTEGQTPEPLTDADRANYLERAGKAFNAVVQTDDHSANKTLLMYQAMFGMAAVAEAQGKLDDAKSWYEKAAARAGEWYPALADKANRRAADTLQQTRTPTFLAMTDRAKLAGTPETREPATMDDWAKELLLPAPPKTDNLVLEP